jgi:hypothetical protein
MAFQEKIQSEEEYSNTRLSLSSGAIIELRQTPGTTTAEPNEQG